MNAPIILAIILCVTITITPTRAENDRLCWNKISKCILDHEARSLVEPKYNPKSPSFNMTDYLCCPLMVQTVETDKACFCTIDTVLHQNPTLASNVTTIFSVCSIVDSLASLDNLCLGIAPTPAEAPLYPDVEAPLYPDVEAPMMPVLPPL
ncbi:hypothetical protein RND81_13G052600 [Saponaria officinalis]|uniref:Bifunctional inhibitor/plant lipid transfer protein/seed storage helical domain-containing protein n=1 Tax=Saponaria officinalis TaxID=3572 RepID=A0AAW1GWA0_SAPOF